MSSKSPIYKITAQNGHGEKEASHMDHHDATKTPKEKEINTQCGLWTCQPGFIQPCANIGCFTALYSLAALVTSTLSVYVNSQITTLERQFGFSSKQTGVIMAANDIGFLVCVLFVSYSATRLHIPRSLGIATMIFGSSGVACSLPHFLFGSQINFDPTEESFNMSLAASSKKSKAYGSLCDLSNDTTASCAKVSGGPDAPSSVVPETIATASMVLIVIGMMLQGFGKAPRYAFTVTYVDDNTAKVNTGFYMGIITTIGILGPALAFFMGGIFTRLYVTLEATKLTPRHPKWIGAWWLGYIVFGILGLLVAVPLFWFPRKLPRRESKKGKNEKSGEDSKDAHVESYLKPHDDKEHFEIKHTHSATESEKTHGVKSLVKVAKDFFSTLLRLWSNPVYLCMVGSSCFIIFSVGGSSAYAPKYLEGMFDLPAFKANYIMAGQTLAAACVGTFIGGYLTKKLRMTAKTALVFIMVVVFISVCANFTGFIFRCDQPVVHNWPGSQETCYDDCKCEDNSYFAICGEDGKTYYSPCHAGCSEMEEGVYSNCTCIPGGMAKSGTCPYGCDHLYPYTIFIAIGALTGTLSIMPKMIVFIRCVRNSDKSLAIGFSTFMSALLGWLLGPIVFGNVIDGICTIWDIECGVTGRCLLYDMDVFRLKYHGYSCVARGASLTCIVIAYIYARCTKCLDDPEEMKKLVKKKLPEISLVVNEVGAGGDDVAQDGGFDENGEGKDRDVRSGNGSVF